MIIKKLVKLGNSKAVLLPNVFLRQLGLEYVAEVELVVKKGHILIRPIPLARDDKARRAEKFASMDENYNHLHDIGIL